MASLMNGLSAMGAGTAAFAGTAGLEQQRADLAQQAAILADQLATVRGTTLQSQAGQIAATAAEKDQTFRGGLAEKELASRASLAASEQTAAMARAQLAQTGETSRAQMALDAPTPEIKSAKMFAKLSPDEKQAYREEMMTKAGLPAWMIGGGDTPSPPTGSTGAGAGITAAPSDSSTGAAPAPSPVTGTTAAPDPAASNHNEKALDGVPPAASSIVKGMVDGRISPPSSFAMSKPYWQGLISKAAEYDPTFDQTTWAGRVATRKSFTAGQDATAVTALNTALGHAGRLADQFTALNNAGGIATPINAPLNAVESFFGDSRQTNVQQTVGALASEARKVFAASGGGNLTELNNWEKTFPLNGSPSQQQGALTNFVELLDSRLQALADKYNRGMGRTDDPMTLLQPNARATYARLTGHEPEVSTGSQMGNSTPGGSTTSAPKDAPTPAVTVPPWVKPGDQYSPSRGQARGADGTLYGPPQ